MKWFVFCMGLSLFASGCGGDNLNPAESDTDTDPCLSTGNAGCEFWAVDLDNAESFVDLAAGGQFAVSVTNPGRSGTASVEVSINEGEPGGDLDLTLFESRTIPVGERYIFRLPRRDVDGDNVDDNVDDGSQTWLSSRAFRITSDVAVVAHQFNTLDATGSVDATLLWPTPKLGLDYLVVGYPPSGPYEGMGPGSGLENRAYITIVGTEEATIVEVVPMADIADGQGVSETSQGTGIEAGTSRSFHLGPFDVLNLETKLVAFGSPSPDLTGSVVSASNAVAVFFGVDLAIVTEEVNGCCADHLEQQVPPSSSMGTRFAVSHSARRGVSTTEPDLYRVIALNGDTSITTSLPVPDDSFSLDGGEHREFMADTDFALEASGPVHVAQFLFAREDTEDATGDPSIVYIPAVDNRRGHYIFSTGEGNERSHAVISMPKGTQARIDGIDVTLSCDGPFPGGRLSGTSYESWTCDILDGAHTVHSGISWDQTTSPIGVLVYSYDPGGAFAYAAGMEL